MSEQKSQKQLPKIKKLDTLPGTKISKIIAVMSGKGGVGKSTIAGLLAHYLNREDNRVGILDADITGPSIPKIFGLTEEIQPTQEGWVPPKSKGGISLMSLNLLLPKADDPVIWRGPLISNTLRQFYEKVLWGQLDYLVIDLPPGTSDASLTVMQTFPLNGAVIVTSPQDMVSLIVRKSLKMTKVLGVEVLGLIENMSHVICPDCGKKLFLWGEGQSEEVAQKFKIPLLGKFPLDYELVKKCDEGDIESYQNDKIADIFDNLKIYPTK